MERNSGNRASPTDIAAEFTQISTFGPHNFFASHFDALTTLELSSSDISNVLEFDILEHQSIANDFFPLWKLPPWAQVGLVDLAFQVGGPRTSGLVHEGLDKANTYPNLLKALQRRDGCSGYSRKPLRWRAVIRRYCGIAFVAVGGVIVAADGAHADFVGDVARVLCAPELGTFSFEITSLRGEKAFANLKRLPNKISDRYGIHDLSGLMDIEPSGRRIPENRVVRTRSASLQCIIGSDQVDVEFEPLLIPPCEGPVTAIVTASINGRLVLDRFPFDTSCRDFRAITRFSFTEGDTFFSLSGVSGPAQVFGGRQVTRYIVFGSFRFRSGDLSPLSDFDEVDGQLKP